MRLMDMKRTAPDTEKFSREASILAQALPHMQRYEGRTVVVKYGGHAMGDPKAQQSFARDIALLKQSKVNPIVVHGGGPQIKTMLEKMGVESKFEGGLRVTDAHTMEIVEMVLAGSINKAIVAAINKVGGTAVGLSGKDGGLILARKLTRTKRDPDSNIERILDLGFVGEPERINPGILETLAKSDIIPVIAPVGAGAQGETYNINADTVAGAVAGAVRAARLLMMTDVMGVLDKNKALIPRLSVAQVRAMIADGTIHGGMIPKVEMCLEAVDLGVEAAVILDGRVPHAILLELFTERGVGTMIGSGA
jgi:acetylglutamate kinase